MANVAFLPLGTPLLAGPGAIVATMLFVKRINGASDAIAFSAALVAVGVILWLFLRYCNLVVRILRPSGVELLARISGLLVSAIAVQLIARLCRGIRAWRLLIRDVTSAAELLAR